MGLSIRSRKYRYTKWTRFDKASALPIDWDNATNPTEFYNHLMDPDENYNEAGNVAFKDVITLLDKVAFVKNTAKHAAEWDTFILSHKTSFHML